MKRIIVSLAAFAGVFAASIQGAQASGNIVVKADPACAVKAGVFTYPGAVCGHHISTRAPKGYHLCKVVRYRDGRLKQVTFCPNHKH